MKKKETKLRKKTTQPVKKTERDREKAVGT